MLPLSQLSLCFLEGRIALPFLSLCCLECEFGLCFLNLLEPDFETRDSWPYESSIKRRETLGEPCSLVEDPVRRPPLQLAAQSERVPEISSRACSLGGAGWTVAYTHDGEAKPTGQQ